MRGFDHDARDGDGSAGGVPAPSALPPGTGTGPDAGAGAGAGSDAGADASDATLDATHFMDDEEWLEHALGDLHSSAWLTPTVEL